MTKTTRPREILTPAALHVLLSFVDGANHGYGIKLDIEERTDGALQLGPGTLYEAIHRMQKDGWIEEAGQEGRRKYYRITPMGRRQLKAELTRLDGIVRFARSKSLLGSER